MWYLQTGLQLGRNSAQDSMLEVIRHCDSHLCDQSLRVIFRSLNLSFPVRHEVWVR